MISPPKKVDIINLDLPIHSYLCDPTPDICGKRTLSVWSTSTSEMHSWYQQVLTYMILTTVWVDSTWAMARTEEYWGDSGTARLLRTFSMADSYIEEGNGWRWVLRLGLESLEVIGIRVFDIKVRVAHMWQTHCAEAGSYRNGLPYSHFGVRRETTDRQEIRLLGDLSQREWDEQQRDDHWTLWIKFDEFKQTFEPATTVTDVRAEFQPNPS